MKRAIYVSLIAALGFLFWCSLAFALVDCQSVKDCDEKEEREDDVYLKIEYKTKTIEFMESGKFDESIISKAYVYRGNIYLKAGYTAKAISDYQKAIVLDPENVDAYENCGIANDEIHYFDIAVSYYNKAIELNTNDAGIYLNRALTYRNMGDFENAINDNNKAIELGEIGKSGADTVGLAYTRRGIVYERMSNYDMAIKDYSKAVELNNNYSDAFFFRAGAYTQIGEIDSALKDYTKAIEINPNYAKAYYSRAEIYAKVGREEESVKDYEKYLELQPDAYDRDYVLRLIGQDVSSPQTEASAAAELSVVEPASIGIVFFRTYTSDSSKQYLLKKEALMDFRSSFAAYLANSYKAEPRFSVKVIGIGTESEQDTFEQLVYIKNNNYKNFSEIVNFDQVERITAENGGRIAVLSDIKTLNSNAKMVNNKKANPHGTDNYRVVYEVSFIVYDISSKRTYIMITLNYNAEFDILDYDLFPVYKGINKITRNEQGVIVIDDNLITQMNAIYSKPLLRALKLFTLNFNELAKPLIYNALFP